MSPAINRRLAAWLAVASLLLALPASTSATISGGCTGEGHASSSGSVDLTTEPVWHLRSNDVAGGSGQSTATMTSATLSAYALGFAIPIASGSGKGDTTGSVDDVSLDTLSKLGKVFVVAGHATGDGACDGQVLIIIDDVDAMFTVLGGGGLLIFILSLGAMLLTGRAGGCLSKLFAIVFGGIAATGLGLSLTQFEIISPTSPVGIVIVLIGAVLGFVVALRLGAPGLPKPPDTPVVAGAVGSEPGAGSTSAIDATDGAPADAVPGTVASGVGSTPDDVGKGAMDLLSGNEGLGEAPPPPDPNAPGVDVGEPPTDGPVGADGKPLP